MRLCGQPLANVVPSCVTHAKPLGLGSDNGSAHLTTGGNKGGLFYTKNATAKVRALPGQGYSAIMVHVHRYTERHAVRLASHLCLARIDICALLYVARRERDPEECLRRRPTSMRTCGLSVTHGFSWIVQCVISVDF